MMACKDFFVILLLASHLSLTHEVFVPLDGGGGGGGGGGGDGGGGGGESAPRGGDELKAELKNLGGDTCSALFTAVSILFFSTVRVSTVTIRI